MRQVGTLDDPPLATSSVSLSSLGVWVDNGVYLMEAVAISLEFSMVKLEGPLGGGHVIGTQLIPTDRPLQQLGLKGQSKSYFPSSY